MESETSRPARDLARIEAEAKNNGVKDLKQEHKNRSSCPELENDHDIKKNIDPFTLSDCCKTSGVTRTSSSKLVANGHPCMSQWPPKTNTKLISLIATPFI